MMPAPVESFGLFRRRGVALQCSIPPPSNNFSWHLIFNAKSQLNKNPFQSQFLIFFLPPVPLQYLRASDTHTPRLVPVFGVFLTPQTKFRSVDCKLKKKISKWSAGYSLGQSLRRTIFYLFIYLFFFFFYRSQPKD